MNEQLIPISYDHETPTVSGRDLHAALEVETRYNDWFPRMCEYGFVEGKDFYSVLSKSTGGRAATDHLLSIPMAKELCMLQRTDKGREFRQYFISVEDAWNDPDAVIERAERILRKRVEAAERCIFGLLEENETLEIALNESLKYYTVAKYNHVFKCGWSLQTCQRVGREPSAFCRARAIEIRACETNDERFGTVNSYPITAWEAYVEGRQHV